MKRNLRRLRRARRETEAFAVRNVYQGKLKALLATALGHMGEAFCGPAEAAHFERWWTLTRALRRCLDAPEMATTQARTLWEKWVEMKPDELIRKAEKVGRNT